MASIQGTLLSQIYSPTDLKKLKETELSQLCDEIRQFIINETSTNPGHLGAGLGVVELTVALHYVFNTPYDKLIWDVGHQAYAHKIITGRKDLFHLNRMIDGISGFPKMSESEYDAFGVGHAENKPAAEPPAELWNVADVRQEVDRVLLSRYSLAAVVVDQDLEVLEIRGTSVKLGFEVDADEVLHGRAHVLRSTTIIGRADRFVEDLTDDGDAGVLVVVVALEAFQNLGSLQQADAAARNDAFFDRRAGGVEGVVDAVLLFLHFDFGRAADADHRNAAGQLGQTFLQLFLVIVAGGFFSLLADLGF